MCRSYADYLDNGNNKMAIQQADKLLKKHKDLHCAKVSVTAVHCPRLVSVSLWFSSSARGLPEPTVFLNPLEHLGRFQFT